VHVLYFADIRFPMERANGIQSAETCAALARRGHEVTMVVRPDRHGPPRDPWEFYGLSPHPTLHIEMVPYSVNHLASRLRYLVAAMSRAAQFQGRGTVLTRDLGIASAILHLPLRSRPSLVYEAHGVSAVVGSALDALLSGASPAGERKQRRLMHRERYVWRNADGYICITDELRAELESRFGERSRVAVIPDGVRLASGRVFTPPFRSGPPTVGYSGHFYPWKGVDTVLQALALAPGFRGLLVGGHPREPDLERMTALARELGLEDRVEFTGLVSPGQVQARLYEADILVLPNHANAVSSSYTSPLKMFEYLAAGRPIVASDLPAFREILRDGENALLVLPGDAAEFAAAFRRLLDDPTMAERIARTAWEEAAAHTWDARAARIEALVGSVYD
jgi:glycosyltransferase involved in cell wall biosynthesis